VNKVNTHKNVLEFDVAMYKTLCMQISDRFDNV